MMAVVGQKARVYGVAVALSAILTLLLADTATAVATADRRPVTMSGLTPDNWGQSLSQADATARDKWPSYKRAWCRGIYMSGYRSESSFLFGSTRYWDKTFCIVAKERNAAYGTSFVLDAKGRSSGIKMYRVKSGYFIPPSQRGGSGGGGLGVVGGGTGGGSGGSGSGGGGCDPNYRGACVPNVPYDLDCADIDGPVYVVGVDHHRFDGDGDGVGCES
jgi:hypothetical protein